MLVPSFFTEEELRPVIAAVNECVDILANKLFNGGKIKVTRNGPITSSSTSQDTDRLFCFVFLRESVLLSPKGPFMHSISLMPPERKIDFGVNMTYDDSISGQ